MHQPRFLRAPKGLCPSPGWEMSLLHVLGPALSHHSQEQLYPTAPSWFQPWDKVHCTLSPPQKVPELGGGMGGGPEPLCLLKLQHHFQSKKLPAQAKKQPQTIPSSSSSTLLPQQGNLNQAFCSGEQREAGRGCNLRRNQVNSAWKGFLSPCCSLIKGRVCSFSFPSLFIFRAHRLQWELRGSQPGREAHLHHDVVRNSGLQINY